MSRVIVRPLNVLGSAAGGLTSFSDTLISPPAALGANWMVGYDDFTQASVFLPPQCSRTATGFQMKNPTGGGSGANMLFLPVVVGGLLGKTQFAQMTYISNIINFPAAGPMVGGTADSLTATSNGYWAQIIPPSPYAIVRASVAHATVQATAVTPAINDVVRISIQYGASANTVILSVNGAVIATVVDNGALRPPLGSGIPGFFFGGASAGSSITCAFFSCGPGL